MSETIEVQESMIPTEGDYIQATNSMIINEKKQEQVEHVKDKYFVVHIMFFLLGLCLMIPGSFFLLATNYYTYKFRDPNSNETSSSERTFLQSHFSAAALACGSITSILSLIGAKMCLHKFKIDSRLWFGYSGALIPFVTATMFIYIDTDSWQVGFFVLTLALIVLITMIVPFGSLSVFEKLGSFPPSVLKCCVVGQGISSILIAILQIVSLAIGSGPTSSALIYFGTGIVLLSFNLLYFAFGQKMHFYKHYAQKKIELKRDSIRDLFEAYKKVWKLSGIYVFIMVSQLLVHPSISSLVVSEYEGSGDWSDIYFTPVIAFLLPGIFEAIGRTVGGKFGDKLNPTLLTILCFIRLLTFVFLIIFCNAQPRTNLPVLFPHDYQFVIIMICYSFSGGFFYILTFTTIGKYVPPEQLNTAFSSIVLFDGFLSATTSVISYFTINFL